MLRPRACRAFGTIKPHDLTALPRLRSVPCLLMRGGTSRGPYFLASDLPTERWTPFLLDVMGSPHALQITGLGGGNSLTSKVGIMAPSQHGEDVDYTFAQVRVDEAVVKWKANCGNILAGVGPAAIMRGLVKAEDPETKIRIFNTNTKTRALVTLQTPGGQLTFDGPTAIDGVPGTSAPIKVTFLDVLGARTGKIFPTGHRSELIDGVRVTCIDSANPVVLMHFEQLGLETGHEAVEELNHDLPMLQGLEHIRQEASLRMALGPAQGKNLPKVAVLSPPSDGGSICSRYFVPDRCHAAHAVTGAIAIAVATTFDGTVAEEVAVQQEGPLRRVEVEHPSGRIQLDLVLDLSGSKVGRSTGAKVNGRVKEASLIRTAKPIMDGQVFVCSRHFEE